MFYFAYITDAIKTNKTVFLKWLTLVMGIRRRCIHEYQSMLSKHHELSYNLRESCVNSESMSYVTAKILYYYSGNTNVGIKQLYKIYLSSSFLNKIYPLIQTELFYTHSNKDQMYFSSSVNNSVIYWSHS